MNPTLKFQLREISALAFLTGFFSLCLQVVATHYAFLAHPQTSYAIGMSLFSFLTGLGVASQLSVKFQDLLQRNFRKLVAWVFTCVGLYFLMVTMFSNELREEVRRLCMNLASDPGVQHTISITILSFFFLFIPAVALGLLFPVINDRRANLKTPETGKTSFYDYLGAGIGALLCAFWLVPLGGLKNASIAVSTFMIAASLPWHGNWLRLAVTVVALTLPPLAKSSLYGEISGAHFSIAQNVLLFSEPSPFGEVSVMAHRTQVPHSMTLMIGLRAMCADTDNLTERMLSRIPLDQVRGEDLNVANVGLGCGFTARILKREPKVANLDIVEINPVIPKATKFFNPDLFSEPHAPHLHIADGYDFFRRSTANYDIVVVDVEEPSVVHSSALFTQDFFKEVNGHLNERGMFTLWTFYEPATGRIILNTLRSVFQFADVLVAEQKLVFVAANRPFDLGQYRNALPLKRRLLSMPQTEIATIADNPYAKYFKVNSVFGLPPWYEDPFEMRN